jgi:hypothetical protein
VRPEDVPFDLWQMAEFTLATKCISEDAIDDEGPGCDCPSDEQIKVVIAAALTELNLVRTSAGVTASFDAAAWVMDECYSWLVVNNQDVCSCGAVLDHSMDSGIEIVWFQHRIARLSEYVEEA